MSISDIKKTMGREPYYICQLDMEICQNVYGVAPCTATGNPGAECYNTWTTCQDTDNYIQIIKPFSFFPQLLNLPIGVNGYPCINKHPVFTPPVLEFMKGLGKRGAVQVTFDDFTTPARDLDPYWATRITAPAGTFWGRFRALFPFYNGRLMHMFIGYLNEPYDLNNMIERLYIIQDFIGPNQNNTITISGRDILKLVDNDRAQAPIMSDAWITEDLTQGETQISYAFSPGYDLPATDSYIRIDEEIIFYANNDGTVLSGCERGAWETDEPLTHEIDSSIQLCLVYDYVNVVDIIYDLFVNYGPGIDPDWIPLTDWEYEKNNWLLGNNLRAIVSEPMGVNDLLNQLTTQNAISLWWDETQGEIRLKALSPEPLNAEIPIFSDETSLIADSIIIKDYDEFRITELWIYYGMNDPTNDIDDSGNYKRLSISVDSDAEGPNEFNSKRIRIIHANWLDETAEALVIQLSDRVFKKLASYTRTVQFDIDAKDLGIWTGGNVILSTDKIQHFNGQRLQQTVVLISAKEIIPATRYRFQGFSTYYDIGKRYGFITYNDFPNYDGASEDQKRTGCFLSDGENNFPDGGEPYKVS